MLTFYLVITATLFFILALSWSKDNFLNLIFKVLFFFLGAIGVFLLLEMNGYIIKVSEPAKVEKVQSAECHRAFTGELTCMK